MYASHCGPSSPGWSAGRAMVALPCLVASTSAVGLRPGRPLKRAVTSPPLSTSASSAVPSGTSGSSPHLPQHVRGSTAIVTLYASCSRNETQTKPETEADRILGVAGFGQVRARHPFGPCANWKLGFQNLSNTAIKSITVAPTGGEYEDFPAVRRVLLPVQPLPFLRSTSLPDQLRTLTSKRAPPPLSPRAARSSSMRLRPSMSSTNGFRAIVGGPASFVPNARRVQRRGQSRSSASHRRVARPFRRRPLGRVTDLRRTACGRACTSHAPLGAGWVACRVTHHRRAPV